jgi:uncharacterized protein YbcI
MIRETRQSRDGPLAAAITTKVVQVFGDYTGRGPTRGRTFINENLVSCLLRDTLTKPERSLVAAGEVDTVLEVRRRFQATMRDDLVAAVEDLTGREVAVFMSENHVDPDVALETFVLEPAAEDRDAFHPGETDAGET